MIVCIDHVPYANLMVHSYCHSRYPVWQTHLHKSTAIINELQDWDEFLMDILGTVDVSINTNLKCLLELEDYPLVSSHNIGKLSC